MEKLSCNPKLISLVFQGFMYKTQNAVYVVKLDVDFILEQQEKEKIVLYIPTGEDLDKKIKTIGLCEALVKFTQ